MPSHLAPSAPPPVSPEPTISTEMPPPLFTTDIPILPLIDQFGIMLIVATSIIAGILVFIVFRRSRKK